MLIYFKCLQATQSKMFWSQDLSKSDLTAWIQFYTKKRRTKLLLINSFFRLVATER